MKELTFKEALIAHLQGEIVEARYNCEEQAAWQSFLHLFGGMRILQIGESHEELQYEFRLAPTTITINGVEIEAPFVPEDGEKCWAFNMCGSVYEYAMDETYAAAETLVRHGNCFRTREAAKAAFEAVSKALKGGA